MRFLLLALCAPGVALAQQPDTVARPAVLLPTVETTAPQKERVDFEVDPRVAALTMRAKLLTSAPRFFGEADVLRAVRSLPGVNARNDYSVGMNVRGGEADQNLVLLDGHPIYNPFHMGGVFGAFVEPMVEDVEFLTGGFPARYGGRLSSVLDVRSRVEPRAGLHGSVNVSLIATTLALGTATSGARHTWNVAARRTYADKVIDLFQDDALPYHFRDLQAYTTHQLGNWRMGVTFYDNVDQLLQPAEADAAIGMRWGNRLAGLTFTRMIHGRGPDQTDSIRLEQRFSASGFRMGMDLIDETLTLRNQVSDRRISGALVSYTDRRTRTVGYEISRQYYRFSANYPLLLYPADTLRSRNHTVAAFWDERWTPAPRWIVQPGLRIEVVAPLNTFYLQPRLAVKYFVTQDLAITGAYGEFAQASHSLAREDVPVRALDFWVGSDSRAPVSRARHFIGGVERWLEGNRAVRVEAFIKQYPSLIEQDPHSDPSLDGDEFLRIRGVSYGADLMLRQFERDGWAGWLAYNFAFSRRVDPSGRAFFPGQDRRHELNVVMSRTGARYTWSSRLNVASGTPYTALTGEFNARQYDPVTQAFWQEDVDRFLTSPRNSERLPLATRLDLSVTRNGRGRVAISPFLSVMNVYNARNPFAYAWDYEASPPERFGLPQFPLFPTLGMSIVW